MHKLRSATTTACCGAPRRTCQRMVLSRCLKSSPARVPPGLGTAFLVAIALRPDVYLLLASTTSRGRSYSHMQGPTYYYSSHVLPGTTAVRGAPRQPRAHLSISVFHRSGYFSRVGSGHCDPTRRMIAKKTPDLTRDISNSS